MATLISWVAVGLALGVVGWSLQQPWTMSLVMSGLLVVVCVIVIARLPLQTVGVISVALFCVTASWDQVSVGGIKVRMVFLLLGFLVLAPGIDLRRLPPVPWWLHAYGLTAIVVTALQTMSPIDQSYLAGRYATSATGQLLGERLPNLVSLLSLLFNTYFIPIMIVLACMYLPRALTWLIAAYVVGVTLSSAAGILGYYGQPAIVEWFGGLQAFEGVRASGFTSHPLRLATSGVMGIGLATWLALQPRRGLKWCGRISMPFIIMGLYVTGSRGGLVAGLLVLILCMVMLPDVRRRIHVVVSGLGAAILGLYLVFPSVVHGVIGSTRILGDDPTASVSNADRAELLAQGLHDFYASPIFGIGIRFIPEAHTLYLGVLAAGGLLFGASYMLFNVGSIRTNLQAVKVDPSLGRALLATLIGSLGYWVVADLIQTATVAIIYGFVIALWWQGQRDAAGPPSGDGAAGDIEVMARPENDAVKSPGERAE